MRILSLLEELQSFAVIKVETMDKAKQSKITTRNNPEFSNLVKDYAQGDYDEDPVILVQRLESLLN